MTDKEKIRKEVEKLKLCTMDEHMKFYSDAAEAEYNALCNIEHFIDSLQEEPVSEDLEDAAKYYIPDESYHMIIESKEEGSGENVYDYIQMIDMFKAGAKFQKEKMMANTADAMIGLPYENKDTETCKSCKRRYDDAHLSFPDCWDGHKEENKRRGTGCKYYVFDENIL